MRERDVNEVRYSIVHIGTLSMNKFWGETERRRSPSSTCTLLELDGERVIVDPSPEPEQLERELFATTGLRPADVGAVFLTHHHGDHRMGIELFDGKPWLMTAASRAEWRERSPGEGALIDRIGPAEGALPEWIELVRVPGHTHGHGALRTRTRWGTLLVAGDSVMTGDFFAAEEGFHNSVDFAKATDTIRAIKGFADLVIPGHGNLILHQRV